MKGREVTWPRPANVKPFAAEPVRSGVAAIRDFGEPRERARRRAVDRPRLRHHRGDRAQPRRHRPRRIEQARRSAQFHHLPSGEDDGVARLCAPAQGLQALPHRPPAVRAGRQRPRRNRDDEPRHAGARGSRARDRRKRAFFRADGRRRGGAGAHQRAGRLPVDRPRRRGAAGALHRARQDHARRVGARPIRALPEERRAQGVYGEVDHLAPSGLRARSPRCGAPAWPSTTANSMPNCAAWRCRCAISAAR